MADWTTQQVFAHWPQEKGLTNDYLAKLDIVPRDDGYGQFAWVCFSYKSTDLPDSRADPHKRIKEGQWHVEDD